MEVNTIGSRRQGLPSDLTSLVLTPTIQTRLKGLCLQNRNAPSHIMRTMNRVPRLKNRRQKRLYSA